MSKLILSTTCVLCGKSGYHWATYSSWEFSRCHRCDLIFLSRAPSGIELDDSDITSIYQSEQYVDGYESEENTYSREVYDFISQLKKFVVNDGELFCDVGCSIGIALAEAKNQGFSPIGVELSTYAADIARKKVGCPVLNCDIYDKQFSAISDISVLYLNHILEHFPNPVVSLNHLTQRLTKHGVVWINVPLLGLRRRFKSALGHYNSLALGEHFYWFSQHSLARLLEITGFEIVWSQSMYESLNKKWLPIQLLSRIFHIADAIAVIAARKIDRTKCEA